MPLQVPDDSDFSSFKAQCEDHEGWSARYSKGGVTVWCRDEECDTVQKLKMRIVCKDVTAETLYDVLHDTSYRKKWDTNMIDTFDIGRLTVNADVGYYSWRCPSPLKNRDFVTMRSWLPLGSDYMIINYSVKHPAMRKIYKACLKYPEWKRKHNPNLKPWMYPEQNTLPCISLSELTLQRADSLENIDESGLSEEKAQHSDDEEPAS